MSATSSRTISPAGLGRRVPALLADIVVVYILCEAPLWAGASDERSMAGAIIALVYFLSRDAFFGGCSFGKKIVGLRVLNFSTLSPAGLRESVRRNGIFLLCCFAVVLIDSLLIRSWLPFPVFALIGIVAVAGYCFRYVEKPKHRTKMDIFGETVVVVLKERANQSPEPTVMSVTPPAAQEPRQP